MPLQTHAHPIERYAEIIGSLLGFYLWYWRTDINHAVMGWIDSVILGREPAATQDKNK